MSLAQTKKHVMPVNKDTLTKSRMGLLPVKKSVWVVKVTSFWQVERKLVALQDAQVVPRVSFLANNASRVTFWRMRNVSSVQKTARLVTPMFWEHAKAVKSVSLWLMDNANDADPRLVSTVQSSWIFVPLVYQATMSRIRPANHVALDANHAVLTVNVNLATPGLPFSKMDTVNNASMVAVNAAQMLCTNVKVDAWKVPTKKKKNAYHVHKSVRHASL